MEQSQLIELIKTLKPGESSQILNFLAVDLHNSGKTRSHLVPLFNLFLNHIVEKNALVLEKNEVFSIVFPNQPFIEGKLEKLMVEAHKVIRKFLLTQRYFRSENEFTHLLDFAEEIRSRGLKKRYHQMLEKIQNFQNKSNHNIQFFQRQFLLEYSKFEEETIHNQAKGDLNIPNTLFALEADYCLKRLTLLNHYILQQKIAHINVSDKLDFLLKNIQIPEEFLKMSIYIRINYEIFSLLKKASPNAEEIQPLFDLLKLHENKLESKNLSDFYAFLRNLCVLSISSNYEKIELASMLHEIYKGNLIRGYMHSEGKISRSKYMAIANNALLIDKYDWALGFIEKYKHELQDVSNSEDIYRLNLANYFFKVGRFSDCLDNIPATSPYLLYLLLGKRLELKSLYELHSELLPYKLDAFKMFLSRTSKKLLSDSQRQIHLDFANLLTQISTSLPGDQKRSELLVKRIQEKKQAAEYRWLLEKAKALKEK